MEKIWFITGASSGLGRGIARAVLRRGDRAVITARDTDSLKELTVPYPDRTLAVPLELADVKSIRAAVKTALGWRGRIDVLVNNAGHGYRAAVEESEPDRVEELFRTNFFGPLELIRQVLPGMRARRGGCIVNVTSIGAVRGALGNGCYSAAKGALELATEALAKETGTLGIRTMLVEPGAMQTGFYGARMAGTAHPVADYDTIAAQYRKEYIRPLQGRYSDPDRCGEVVVATALRTDAPFRLLLGSDAVQAAEQTYEKRLGELRAWRDVSVQTDRAEDE